MSKSACAPYPQIPVLEGVALWGEVQSYGNHAGKANETTEILSQFPGVPELLPNADCYLKTW